LEKQGDRLLKRNCLHLVAPALFVALLCLPATTWAQFAPALGNAAEFGALANSGVTGASGAGVVVTGDVGSSPTFTIINFPPSRSVPPFAVHFTNDGFVQQAHIDAVAAGLAIFGQTPGSVVLADNLAAAPALTAGKYVFTTGAADLPASTTLTLNGPGVFIFNATSLTANVLSNVVGTADPCNIFWKITGVSGSATLNGTNFMGTVIADVSITLGAGANLAGRMLAGVGPAGAITMAGAGGNTVGGCSVAVGGPTPVPALPQWTMIALTVLLALAGLVAMRRRQT
jgi:MYXO-CTERM domain-containing protein